MRLTTSAPERILSTLIHCIFTLCILPSGRTTLALLQTTLLRLLRRVTLYSIPALLASNRPGCGPPRPRYNISLSRYTLVRVWKMAMEIQ